MGWDKKKLGRYPKKIFRLLVVQVKYDFWCQVILSSEHFFRCFLSTIIDLECFDRTKISDGAIALRRMTFLKSVLC
jgi:hypothetical protein